MRNYDGEILFSTLSLVFCLMTAFKFTLENILCGHNRLLNVIHGMECHMQHVCI
jgi:hypothetical protein